MSAQYDLYESPDIKQTGEKQPLYPRIVAKGTIDQNEFLDRVHKLTGMSRSMLAGVMLSFQNEVENLLANGWIVELGDMGYFSLSLQCPPVMDKKEIHAQSVQLKNINFRAGSQFKKEVEHQLRLERTESFTRPKGKGLTEEECLRLLNEYLQKYPCINCTEYRHLTGCVKRRALKDLNSFIERGLIIRHGMGKMVVYAKVNG